MDQSLARCLSIRPRRSRPAGVGYNAAGCGSVLRIIGNGVCGAVRVYPSVPPLLVKCLLLEAPNGPVLLQKEP